METAGSSTAGPALREKLWIFRVAARLPSPHRRCPYFGIPINPCPNIEYPQANNNEVWPPIHIYEKTYIHMYIAKCNNKVWSPIYKLSYMEGLSSGLGGGCNQREVRNTSQVEHHHSPPTHQGPKLQIRFSQNVRDARGPCRESLGHWPSS